MTEAYTPKPIAWHDVWDYVADSLATDELIPDFMTEESVRIMTLRGLSRQVQLSIQARIECSAGGLGGRQGDRLDLVTQAGNITTAVEFKYPRGPRANVPAPWPQHLGHMLSDTYRLGILASEDGRIDQGLQVVVAGSTFLRYVHNTLHRTSLATYDEGDVTPRQLSLTASGISRLSATTQRRIFERSQTHHVTANRNYQAAIPDKDLWMAVYDVQAQRVTPATT